MSSLGDKITEIGTGEWKFDKAVADNFEEHIIKSVPQYDEAHNIVTKISDYFLIDQDTAIDIGCSTGSLLRKIAKRHLSKDIKLIGYDNSISMIRKAKNSTNDQRIKFCQLDGLEFEHKSSLVLSLFTAQFIRPKHRQIYIDNIYRNLDWGGGFCFFEKVRGSDARFQDILTSIHWEWKFDNGYTKEEVINKWSSLKAVMEPFSEQGNIDMLKRSGFCDIESVWKWGPFQGFLAIK